VGANTRGASKKKDAESKADEQLKKKQEMADILAADEEVIAGTVFTGKKIKKKGKDDFDKLNEVLAAQPKTKAQKLAEEKKKAAELKRKKEDEARKKRDEEKQKREADAVKAGIVLQDDLLVENTNKMSSDTVDATGISEAISLLSTSGGDDTEIDAHPERRQKALHKAYVEKMMPIVKQDHPGLRMTQYQEKIFEMWKSSAENPRHVASIRAREEQKKATML
jgi:hypothetical protein